MKIYEEFHNGSCKIKFNWHINGDYKKLPYQDFTGPKNIGFLIIKYGST